VEPATLALKRVGWARKLARLLLGYIAMTQPLATFAVLIYLATPVTLATTVLLTLME